MNNSKKIISLLLSVIMIMSVFTVAPFTVNAAEAEASATAETDGDYEYRILDDNTAEITGYSGVGGDVTIPSTLGGYTVTSIGGSAFSWCKGLTSVTIPNPVTSIGESAFYGCTGLTSVTIPDSVTSIDYGAFSGCTGLTSVTIPNSVTSIGGYAFYRCMGLTSVDIPDSVTSIGNWAFEYCTGLTSINIPDSVKSIGGSEFLHCTGLTSIKVADGNTVYDSRDNCNAIIETESNTIVIGCKSTVIPNSVTSIGESAFYGCTGLTSVTIPDSVTSIGVYAFYRCTGLTSVDIPDSVTSISGSAFGGCTGLTSVTIPDSVTTIADDAFSGCTGLTSINIPDSVTSIGWYAFYGCTGLMSITIPDTVTSIGDEALGYYYDDDWNKLKIDGFTIYGYEGSEAEKYAKDNEFTFVPLKSKADVTTGIILAVPEDTDLTVKDITSDISSDLPDGCNVLTAYDISLTKDGETVQPENIVPVKIPCSNENAKVFRFEADGTMTDMNAKYKDGYMVFTTDHFSIYVLAEPKPAGVTVSGNITSYLSDDEVNVTLFGYEEGLVADISCTDSYTIEDVPAGEYVLTVSKKDHTIHKYSVTVADTNVTQDVKISPKGDVNGDGETDIMDCSVAQRYIRELTTLDAYQIACGDVSGEGDGELDIQDVSRILRHIRELAMLY